MPQKLHPNTGNKHTSHKRKTTKSDAFSKILNFLDSDKSFASFGLLLVGLLICGFAFGGFISIIDSTIRESDVQKNQAKAYSIEPDRVNQTRNKASDSAIYTIEIRPAPAQE